MKKLLILGLVLLMVVVFGTPTLAKADVQKLVPYGADPPYPEASGKAIVNDSMGDVVLDVTVSVRGLEPGAEYRVKCWNLEKTELALIGLFTVNKNGNGHFHLNFREGETIPLAGHIFINNFDDNQTVLVDEDY